MKTVLGMSIACSAVSLVGLLGVSAISFAPGLEAWRWVMMLVVLVLLAGWLRLAFWARARLRASSVGPAVVPARLRTTVVVGGVVYILLVLLCSLG